jgi:hypothetical protein
MTPLLLLLAVVGAEKTNIPVDQWVAKRSLFGCKDLEHPDNFWLFEIESNKNRRHVEIITQGPLDKYRIELDNPFRAIEYTKNEIGESWQITVSGLAENSRINAKFNLQIPIGGKTSADFEITIGNKFRKIGKCFSMSGIAGNPQ